MSEEEEIIVPLPKPPPPPPPAKLLGFAKTADPLPWWRKWSTKLAAIALSLDAAALAFVAGPPEWRAGFPVAFGVGLLVASMVVKGLIPFATSIRQPQP